MKKILFFYQSFVSLDILKLRLKFSKKEHQHLTKRFVVHSLKFKKETLVILIAGSGPTDRNGNQKNVVNNSLKYLCEGLTK
jgi:hypothetical protein